MNKYKEFTKLITKISEINNGNESKIFDILKQIIDFKSGYIFFLNPERLIYSFNPKVKAIKEIKEQNLQENLKFKNSVFGVIIITGDNYSDADKEIFKAFASMTANIIKDAELTKVIKMQISALQQGCLDACQNTVKIKQADEIRTKFLSQITHELRTPLNSILGFSELLENEFAGKLNAKQKEYVNDIKISGINLLGMINEILDMSKIEAKAAKLNMQTFSVTTAINEVVNTIMPLIIKKNIKFTKFTEDIEINADYIKFQGIVLNLLGNAIKFTQENGEISIRAYKSGKNLLLSVKDNGAGIDKKFHKSIFNYFEQGENFSKNSTGLGLAITKEFVKMHKGKIDLKSELNKGTEFIITLPINIY